MIGVLSINGEGGPPVSNARAPLTPFGRALIIRRALEEGWPRPPAAVMAGVSRQTVHEGVRGSREEGPAGLEDRPRVAGAAPTRPDPSSSRRPSRCAGPPTASTGERGRHPLRALAPTSPPSGCGSRTCRATTP
ncbi:MAG: hypothetical protein B7Z69_03530 [Actinobacteria bacterium 21-73-9]|nr:MAG: hypothetical protein B7Z69_03530 [Actinobacteria bacterium 21-73-9]